jgi:hypothetical protein
VSPAVRFPFLGPFSGNQRRDEKLIRCGGVLDRIPPIVFGDHLVGHDPSESELPAERTRRW